jgi:tetratricopeptide (TPR) repeat protein
VAGGSALSGCVAPLPPQPIVSPTGIVYEPGTPPEDTRRSQTAVLYLQQNRTQRALDLSLEGIESDPQNPIHYYLAGVAHARLGQYVEADQRFSEAEALYPAYELDIEPYRRAAWADAFNRGVEAYGAGDTEGAIEAWSNASVVYDLSVEAHRNLASLLAVEGRHDEAIEVYQKALAGLEKRPATRVLEASELEERKREGERIEDALSPLLLLTDRFEEAEALLRRHLERLPEDVEARADLANALSGQGREAEARQIYVELLSEEGLQATQLFNLGVALFRTADFPGAASAFQRLTGLQPESRDAWFNYANALFAAEDWPALAEAGGRLVELDPLGENAGLITARAHLESGDRPTALETLERARAAPIYVDELQMRRAGGETTVQGRITGNQAEAGSTIRLRFVFYGESGTLLGSKALSFSAPAAGESERFAVQFSMSAMAYRYEQLN